MEKKITGMMVYYYFVCPKKLWYFTHEIKMEQGNEDVQIGKLLDENSYKGEEKNINIDNVINIDFLKKEGILHEVKKSRKIEEANIWQVKYYLFYLYQKGVRGLKGKIDYPLLKQNLEVELLEEDFKEIEILMAEINKIIAMLLPPFAEKKGFCKRCAYYDLCFI